MLDFMWELEEWYFSVLRFMTNHPYRFWGGAILVALAIFGIGALVTHLKNRD